MRVLMCGSRDWDDQFAVATVLEGLLQSAVMNYDQLVIIEGCARGADRLAHHFFHSNVEHEHYPADWAAFGKAAGFIRNQKMLDVGKPEVVFAFKDGLDPNLLKGGTEDMVRRSKAAGIPTYVIQRA